MLPSLLHCSTYLLYALAICHTSDSDEQNVIFIVMFVQDQCTPPPPQTYNRDVQQFFVIHLGMYFCMDLFTNEDIILFGNKLIDPVYFIFVIICVYCYMF